MAAKGVNAIFYRLLKSFHNEERDDGGTQPNTQAGDSNFMNGGRKSLRPAAAYSFRYEIREIQGMA